MKMRTLAAILSVSTVVGLAGPAMALNSDNNSGPADDTGMTTLGIDISRAGGSSASVQQFLAQLPANTRDSVLNGCQSAVASNDASFHPAVLAFCRTAVGDVNTAYLAPAPARGMFAPSYGYQASPRGYVVPPTVPMGDKAPPYFVTE